jgi:low affinity Fe/Cu permease
MEMSKAKNGKATAQKPEQPSLPSKSVHKVFAAPASKPGWFECFARETALLAGRPPTFFIAVSVIVVWAVTGPLFGFSDTWQLVINTGTTIVTFLMVFLIQQSQNRDSMAVQIKLSELIIAVATAHNALATAEDLSEQELMALHAQFAKQAEHTLRRLEAKRGKKPVREAVTALSESDASLTTASLDRGGAA